MMYTEVNFPYGSLTSVITDDGIERSSLSMWRSIGAEIGGLPTQILLALFVYSAVEGSDAKVLDASKLSVAITARLKKSVRTYCLDNFSVLCAGSTYRVSIQRYNK